MFSGDLGTRQRVWGLGSKFRIEGSGFRAQGPGFWVQGSGFRVQGSGFRVFGRPGHTTAESGVTIVTAEAFELLLIQDLGFRVWGLGLRNWVLGFRV